MAESGNPPAASSERARKFGSRTNAVDVVGDMDLKGKTALITGTNSGIGIETARTLALKGAHVVMANRNIVQSEKLRDDIKKEKPDAEVDLINLDLSSLQSVQAAANEFLSKGWNLHILILNAGVLSPSVKATIDGYETAFGVNHLGHFYLTKLLLDKMRQSAPARIVVVASHSHNHTGIAASLPTSEKLSRLIPPADSSQISYRHYAYSKLCNVLMAMRLHRLEHANGISVYAVHPGTMIATGISRTYGMLGRLFGAVTKTLTKSLQQGAATSVYCAVSEDVNDESGKYFESCWADEKNLAKALAHDEDLQDALWQRSEEYVEKFERSRPSHN